VIDWFHLQGGDFVPLVAEADGTLRRRIFPGLWLNPGTTINGDLAGVFSQLDRTTGTVERAEFIQRVLAR
jgi:hypothetical protein